MSDPAATVRAALVDSLATVPDDVLVEVLVRRGVLTGESRFVNPQPSAAHAGHDPEVKGWFYGCPRCNPMVHDCPESLSERRLVTAWQEADR